MAITGPALGIEWYRKAFHKTLGVKPPVKGEEPPKSKMPADSLAKPSKAGEWLAMANTIYPYKGDVRIALPKGKTGSVNISKTKAGFMASAGVDRLTLDQYSNTVIKNDKFSDKTFAQQVSVMVKAIHTGEVFGLFSKIIYFIACLIATSLPVTGTIIWINKFKKANKKSKTEASLRPQLQVI